MTFYQKLQAETETERQALISVPIIQRALKGNISLDEYQRFLTQAFHHVKHTTPLLMTVGGKLAQDMEWLREAVAEYIEEELGHQEWILNDIAACGSDKEIARNSEPNFSTELMVAYAYDCVSRVHPVCFFGMVLVLEGTSVALADIAANEIAKTLKLPKSAFTYLHSHGALDQEHVVFFQQLMDQISAPEQQQMIIHSAKRFYELYANVFRELDSTISTQIAA